MNFDVNRSPGDKIDSNGDRKIKKKEEQLRCSWAYMILLRLVQRIRLRQSEKKQAELSPVVQRSEERGREVDETISLGLNTNDSNNNIIFCDVIWRIVTFLSTQPPLKSECSQKIIENVREIK